MITWQKIYNWIVSDKEEKVELYRKGDMNTVIHDITYKMNEKRLLEPYQNYPKFKSCFGDYTIYLLVFRYKNINGFDIDIIQTNIGT